MLLIKSQFDEIDATKVDNCKEDVEEVSVEQESNENTPSSLPVQTNEFIVFHDLIFYRPIEEPVVEQVTEPVTEQVTEEVIEAVQEEEKPQEEKPQEEVAEETPVENQEAPKEECSETAAVEEKQPEEEGKKEEGKKEKKPRKFYHGRNGDHKGNVKS